MIGGGPGFGPTGPLGHGQNRDGVDRNDETHPLNRGEMIDRSDMYVRHGFVQKVYGILIIQLTITFVVAAMIMHAGQSWFNKNQGAAASIIVTASLGSLMMMFVFMCCPQTMRQYPLNYVILMLFTLCKAVLVGVLSLAYTQESVLIVVGITVLITLSLTIFACQTTYDFTGFGPYLACGVMVLIGLGFAFMIASFAGVGNSPAFQTVRLLYAGLGALIFSCYIVFDTQLILGGKHNKFRFSVDDYAVAAINLYVDIIQLFMFLLELFGNRR